MIVFQVEIEVKLFLTGTPDLSNEAAGIFIWCLTQSADCYKHWVSYSYQTPYADTRWFLHFPLWPAMQNLYSLLILTVCEQDKLYEANLEGSVKVLKKLSEEWKEHSAKLSPLDPFRATLKSFRQKVSCCCFRILNCYHCLEFLFYFTNEILFGYMRKCQ